MLYKLRTSLKRRSRPNRNEHWSATKSVPSSSLILSAVLSPSESGGMAHKAFAASSSTAYEAVHMIEWRQRHLRWAMSGLPTRA